MLAATIGDVRVVNVYVPNGQAVGSDKFAYKLRWFARAARLHRGAKLARHPRLVVLGDFNVAPEDRDVHDPSRLGRLTCTCSPPERAALRQLLARRPRATASGMFEQPEKSYSAGGTTGWWPSAAMPACAST